MIELLEDALVAYWLVTVITFSYLYVFTAINLKKERPLFMLAKLTVYATLWPYLLYKYYTFDPEDVQTRHE